MSWGAVDDRFWSHKKLMRLRRSQQYESALALWLLSLSWACQQEKERFTGEVPYDALATFGVADWFAAAEALVDVKLWEQVDDETVRFHDWTDWNGIAGKELRSKEQARLRQQALRLRRCESGQHDRHCPSETCPKKLQKDAGNRGSRDPGSGSGRARDGLGMGHEQEEESRAREDWRCKGCGHKRRDLGFDLCQDCAKAAATPFDSLTPPPAQKAAAR